MNPEFGNSGYRRHMGFSRFPMGSPTPERIKQLRITARMPKRGPLTEYARNLARVELLAHQMSGRIK